MNDEPSMNLHFRETYGHTDAHNVFIEADYCNEDPCNNGGSCSNGPSGFICGCVPGFMGITCDVGMFIIY